MSTSPEHPTAAVPQWVESVYERLAVDTDGRVCKAIADEACREAPGNFLRMLLSNAASQVADSLASAGGAMLSIAVALWSWWRSGPDAGAARWFFPLAFLGLGICHAGVRLGRKTYLLDLAEGERRTAYVAVSNSAIGVLLLASGALGALAATVSVAGAVLVLGLAGLAGSALSLHRPEVSQ